MNEGAMYAILKNSTKDVPPSKEETETIAFHWRELVKQNNKSVSFFSIFWRKILDFFFVTHVVQVGHNSWNIRDPLRHATWRNILAGVLHFSADFDSDLEQSGSRRYSEWPCPSR